MSLDAVRDLHARIGEALALIDQVAALLENETAARSALEAPGQAIAPAR